MRDLTQSEVADCGVAASSSLMDNGELRLRLMRKGYGYIMTIMPANVAGWQNSHVHLGILETYVVQEGWIGYAELMSDGTARISVCGPGQLFTTQIEVHHNVYMPSGAVIHTVKHGDVTRSDDWHASPVLDALTKRLSESDIFHLAGLSDMRIRALIGACG